jgi:hypothetical protein
MVTDGYRPLEDDGQPDIAEYNKQLKALGNPKWFNVPWLYAECYLYRYGRALLLHFLSKLTETPKLDASPPSSIPLPTGAPTMFSPAKSFQHSSPPDPQSSN